MGYFVKKMDDFGKKGSWTRKVFADFIDEYQQVTFLCCRTLGLNETEAEDVASETFLAAYKKLDKFRGQSKLSTWIWKIAYYKSIDYIRKNRRDLRVLDEIDDQLADKKIAQVAAELENKEHAQVVWDTVRGLPGDWSIAILLHYRQNKSISEISEIMGKRQNTVKTYLFRGRKKLKTLLADHIGGSDYGTV